MTQPSTERLQELMKLPQIDVARQLELVERDREFLLALLQKLSRQITEALS